MKLRRIGKRVKIRRPATFKAYVEFESLLILSFTITDLNIIEYGQNLCSREAVAKESRVSLKKFHIGIKSHFPS